MSDETASPNATSAAEQEAPPAAPSLPTGKELANRLRGVLPMAMAARDQECRDSLSMLAEKYVGACMAEKNAEDALQAARALMDRTLLEMCSLVTVMREDGANG